MTARKAYQHPRRWQMVLPVIAVSILGLFTIACDPEAARDRERPPRPEPRLAETGLFPGTDVPSWIEYPVEAKVIPPGLMSFVVYAADPRTIVLIDLRLNGQALPRGQLRGVDADGGYRLARLDQPWQLSEGEYILEARARNAAGEYGAPTYVNFCAGSCKVSTPTPTAALTRTPTLTPTVTPTSATVTVAPPTITPTPTPTFTPTSTPTRTPTTPPPPPPASISFRSDAPYVNGGSCTTLRWDVDNVQAVFLDNQPVTGHGTQQVCPCQQTTYTLRVVKRDNTTENRTVTIMVYGSCAPPTTVRPPTTVAPPQDRTPPSISNVGLRFQDCKFFGYATITDPSSVPSAQFWYNLNNGGWKSVAMWYQGSGSWEETSGVSIMSGIGSPIGSVQFYVTATDGAGNQSRSGTSTRNYTGCGG